MSKATHTPGPWSLGIIKATMLNPRSMAVWPDQVEIGQVAEPICLIAPMANYNDTDEANARLIAAAPDLLEALKCVCEYMGWDKNEMGSIPEIQAVKNAIAKATNTDK